VSLSRRCGLAAGLALAVAGCATSGAVRRVETEIAVLRAVTARQDSARAAELARVIALQQRIMDSLGGVGEAVRQIRAEVGPELLSIQQQLAEVQELTGQSQRRLSEIRRQIDDRMQTFAVDTGPRPPAGDSTAAPPTPGPGPSATPDQLYQTSLQQLQRGSMGTARLGFQEFLRLYPTHAQAADALHHLAETFAVQAPDSAASYHGQVVERFPRSSRASTSLYKLGLLAEQRGDRDAARAAYQRVLRDYPRSDEADLARQKLAALRP
jgi:tol-pal system protein YbgF